MKFTTLRGFIEEVAKGGHSVEEINEHLDNIELGIGLAENEKSTAEAMEMLPANDAADPAYRRGFEEGAEGVVNALAPVLEQIEFVEGRCPCCGYGSVHKKGCLLDQFLISIRAAKEQAAAEARLNDGAPQRQ